jgi:hypothetical protein
MAVLCISARRVSKNWDMEALHRSGGDLGIAPRDHEFPMADSLAPGMLFCTEPARGKFLSAIGGRT